MILELGERRQVCTLQESQAPKTLKIQASGRVWIILSRLSAIAFIEPRHYGGGFVIQKNRPRRVGS